MGSSFAVMNTAGRGFTRSEMSSQLYAAAKIDEARKELLIVPEAGHNDAANGKDYSAAFSRLLLKIKK